MTDKLLELEPLRILPGEHDTKHAVLKELNKISLIRFAAHGDAVRGEICLSPIRYANKISDDFILILTRTFLGSGARFSVVRRRQSNIAIHKAIL